MSLPANEMTSRETRTVLTNSTVQDVLDALNDSERRFVVQTTIGLMSPTQAARDAGYAAPPKSRKVLAAITAIRVEMARDLDISFDDIKRGFMSGINTAEMMGDPGGIIKGWSEMAKLLGHYKEDRQPQINIENMTYVEMQDMTDEQLDEIIQRANAIDGRSKRLK